MKELTHLSTVNHIQASHLDELSCRLANNSVDWKCYHILQEGGFSPVWVLMWTTRPLWWLKLLPRYTGIWLLTCVCSHVDQQSTLLTETFTTCYTGIWLLTCVSFHVVQMSTLLTEIFATCYTRICLLACVVHMWIKKLLRWLKLLPHDFTCVSCQVDQQLTLLIEIFIIRCTGMWLLTCVRAQANWQGTLWNGRCWLLSISIVLRVDKLIV